VKKIFLLTILNLLLIMNFVFAGYVLSNGDTTITLTKKDVEITEAYFGATWSTDSQYVYFGRYIDISPSREIQDRVKEIDNKKLDQILNSAGSSAKLLEGGLKNIPDERIFFNPLYKKVIIYSYNIRNNQIRIVSILEIPSINTDSFGFFRDYIVDNKLQFTTVLYIHSIDLLTGRETRTDISSQDEKELDEHFVRKNNKIVLELYGKGRYRSTSFRQLSPDRHSFFEESKGGTEIGFFYDPSAHLKTMEELGWNGGVPNRWIVEQITYYKPNSIPPDKLYTPEEEKIRERLGFSSF